jgi:hypothetical protein
MKSIPRPPDAPLQSLARLINHRLANIGASVNFYRIEHPDQRIDTGIIFSCGPRRANVVTQTPLGEADADDIVANVNAWVAELRPESKWTTDPNEAS